MSRIRFPHNVSNFKKLVTEGYRYIDRTHYLEKMEQMDTNYHFFLRPRRFGKSLAVSVMEYYYGKQHKANFDLLFGNYYIGKNPTPLANAYLVLKFDFSGIETSTIENITSHFLAKVKIGTLTMMGQHKGLFGPTDKAAIEAQESPGLVISKLLELLQEKQADEKIFLIIDEYDHFTNEIIAFHFDNFQKIVSRNGIVRKFYEAVKEGTQSGLLDRMFITGVSPVTLDSLTSGFNIGVNLSLDAAMHDFMGFTEAEVVELLQIAEVQESEMDKTLADVRSWYNGYLFSEEAHNRLYNPDMVLYFVVHYRQRKDYPKDLLDVNIASDYGKIRRMLNVGNQEENFTILEEILREASVSAEITRQFSFERGWTRDDFVSLLFYMGMLTVKGVIYNKLAFQIPNHVITELYYKFFRQVLLDQAHLKSESLNMSDRVIALAKDNDIAPLREALQMVLKNLDNRDARQFSEKHVKTALMSLIVPTGVYTCFSEYPLGQEYADIVMLRRPPILEPKRQYVFKLKYLPKKDASPAAVKKVSEEGREQLSRYLAHPLLAGPGDFTAFLWVVVGYEVKLLEEVKAGVE
jgi:hypothetical protein